jgi:protein phosphatase
VAGDTQFRWISASRTHVGLIRSKNEDAVLDLPARNLWAVADGMGGHAHGDIASRMVIEALNTQPPSHNLIQSLADARKRLQTANRQLLGKATEHHVPVIGSTVVALIAYGRTCGYLWAGDSRLYLYRNGSLKQLTRDHSQMEMFIARPHQLAQQANRPPFRNVITCAVGATGQLELDEGLLDVADGDVFLLCSDGLSNAVSEQDISRVLAGGDCQQAVNALIELALQHGGRDNISVIVVRADDRDSDEKTVVNPAL